MRAILPDRKRSKKASRGFGETMECEARVTREELRSWIKRRRLSHERAAPLLALSVSELRKKLYGAVKVGKQTARIAELTDKLGDAMAASDASKPIMSDEPVEGSD